MNWLASAKRRNKAMRLTGCLQIQLKKKVIEFSKTNIEFREPPPRDLPLAAGSNVPSKTEAIKRQDPPRN
jgi:hypothetical protein